MRVRGKAFPVLPAILAVAVSAILAGCGPRSEEPPPSASAAPEPVRDAGSAVAPAAAVPAPTEVAGGADLPAASGSPAAVPGKTAPAPGAPAGGTGSIPEQATASARRVGEVVYAEGSVTLHRGGREPLAADIGQVVENFDVLATGARSRATLELDAGQPGGAEIRLAENTVFYYESALSGDGARTTALRLLAGSVAFKVEKLSGGEFQVGTDAATLGVRGTTFIVNTVPDGALLVTCAEGRVEVYDDSGERAYAQPGRAVSRRPGEPVREEMVSLESLADYRVKWVDDSMIELEKNALRVLGSWAKRYDKARPRFDAAYSALRELSPVLEMWSVARDSGGRPRITDWIPEKKTVAPVLFDCLAALFELESPFYRIGELSRLRDLGVGQGSLPDGRAAAGFLDAYRTESEGIQARLAWVRRALLLFKYASGDSPLGQFFGAKAESLGGGTMFLE